MISEGVSAIDREYTPVYGFCNPGVRVNCDNRSVVDRRHTGTFAQRIEIALKAKGRDWPDLRAHLKLTRGGIKKWRDGAVPSAMNLLKAADWLNVNFRWLLLGELPIKHQDPITDDEDCLVQTYRQLSPSDKESLQDRAISLLYRRTEHTGVGKPFLQAPHK